MFEPASSTFSFLLAIIPVTPFIIQGAWQLWLLASIMQQQQSPAGGSHQPSTPSTSAAPLDPFTLLYLADAHPQLFAPTLHRQQRPQQRAAPRTAVAVQSAYRRLAAAVHPDKCLSPAWSDVAHAAFQAVGAARDAALRRIRAGGSGGAAGRGGGRASGGWQDDDEDWGGHGSGEADDDDDAAWWKEWDEEVAAGGAGGKTFAPQFPSTAPTAAEVDREAPELRALPLDALRVEVARRQAAVLAPQREEERGMAPAERQRRLRVARDVLSERTRPGDGGLGGGDEDWGTGGPGEGGMDGGYGAAFPDVGCWGGGFLQDEGEDVVWGAAGAGGGAGGAGGRAEGGTGSGGASGSVGDGLDVQSLGRRPPKQWEPSGGDAKRPRLDGEAGAGEGDTLGAAA